jgi:hypothetical protein
MSGQKSLLVKKLLFISVLCVVLHAHGQLGKSTTGLSNFAGSNLALDSIAWNHSLGGNCPLQNLCQQIILPVSILELEGRRMNPGQVKLTWKSSNEPFNAGFYLQRSDGDAQHFGTSAFINVMAGAGSIQTYSTMDTNSNPGASFYRIRQVDIDGKFRYSNVVKVNGSASKLSASIFPNPVINDATVTIQMPASRSSTNIQLMDLSGKVLKTLSVSPGYSGNYRINWFREMPSGFYLMRISDGVETLNLKLVVQH